MISPPAERPDDPSLIQRLSRLYYTLRPIPPAQAARLVWVRLARWAQPAGVDRLPRRPWRTPWSSPRWRHTARTADGAVRFLGVERPFAAADRAVWHDPTVSRLWLYNLHYLDDLDAAGDSFGVDARHELIDGWITANPPGKGAAWEPYPLSLRIVNIVKFAGASPLCSSRWTHSLALQAQSLAQQIEWHIRANHLFENGKALAFAGTFFEGKAAERWLRLGLRILDAECREQFLPDGGHFELSPMYHGIMLWSLCDLLNLARCSALPALVERRPAWRALLQRGLLWYRSMSHPDGEPAFFNDAALGIAPSRREVAEYAHALDAGPLPDKPFDRPPALTRLEASGYARVDLGPGSAAIVDLANVGPSYQPGHAHADTLSFELSLSGHRMFVNSGTSTYERGPQRDLERSTAAHNTVVVDGSNSSDTWAAFRVGRRAHVSVRQATREADGQIVIEAAHDGYRRLLGGATHVRHWTWNASSVAIQDRIVGSFRHAAAHYHVHPGIAVARDGDDRRLIHLRLPDGGQVRFHARQGVLHLQPSTWHPQFGESVPNTRIVLEFTGQSAEALITWRDPQ